MPTYDYKCPKCSLAFEICTPIRLSSAKVHKCWECDVFLDKQVSKSAGVHFKGSGFYETDYKNK